MDWLPTIVAVFLAAYGWFVITWLAKCRAAYDIYCSVISLLEQLEIDGVKAWAASAEALDEYVEIKLLSKIACVEQRLNLIQKYYSSRNESTKITGTQIRELRRYLTTTPDLVPQGESRDVVIHYITNNMISILLEESYEHINKRILLFQLAHIPCKQSQ